MNMTPQVASFNPTTVKVGDGVTESIGSDRRAGTVFEVSKSGKTIKFTRDEATMKPGHSIYSANGQDYDYETVQPFTVPDPVFGTRTNVLVARWSESRQRFVVTGGYALSPGRRNYYDPHF